MSEVTTNPETWVQMGGNWLPDPEPCEGHVVIFSDGSRVVRECPNPDSHKEDLHV